MTDIDEIYSDELRAFGFIRVRKRRFERPLGTTKVVVAIDALPVKQSRQLVVQITDLDAISATESLVRDTMSNELYDAMRDTAPLSSELHFFMSRDSQCRYLNNASDKALALELQIAACKSNLSEWFETNLRSSHDYARILVEEVQPFLHFRGHAIRSFVHLCFLLGEGESSLQKIAKAWSDRAMSIRQLVKDEAAFQKLELIGSKPRLLRA